MVSKGLCQDETIPTSGVRMRAADITALRAEIAALRRERDGYRRHVAVDAVTGLYNRQHFDERLEHEWRRALHFWTPLSLVAIDVGDEGSALSEDELEATVAEIGELLKRHLRDIDIAGRVGSTSFAVLLPGTGRLGAEAELARLGRIVADRCRGEGLAVGLGLAVALDDAHTPLELLITADEIALSMRCQASDDERHETIPVPPSCRTAA